MITEYATMMFKCILFNNVARLLKLRGDRKVEKSYSSGEKTDGFTLGGASATLTISIVMCYLSPLHNLYSHRLGTNFEASLRVNRYEEFWLHSIKIV